MADTAGGGPRSRRALVGLAVVAAVAGVVVISRAGLPDRPDPGSPGASPAETTPPGTPLAGEVLQWAAGEARLYVLAEVCDPTCAPRLVTSGDEGHSWQPAAIPPGLPAGPAAVRTWRLTVAGPDDRLSIEAGGVVTTSSAGRDGVQSEPVADGPPVDRVPTNQEAFTRLCGPPRCRTPAVEFLQPRTGRRSRLAHQPPFAPTVLAVEGSQLWAVAVDPATGRWTAAVSTDDGADWGVVPGPPTPAARGLRARLLPVPGEDQAYLVLSRRTDPPYEQVVSVWTVPNPGTGVGPAQVHPDGDRPLLLESAVATADGRLLLAGGPPVALSPDGGLQQASGDPYRTTVPTAVGRGLHSQLAGVVTDGQVASLALNRTGDPGDWRISRIYLTGR